MALNDEEEAALRAELSGAQKALKEANKEGQGHRLSADRANKAAEQAEAERDAIKADAETRVAKVTEELTGKLTAAEQALADTRTATASRVLRAELRAQATVAGMRDPDDLGALDTSEAKLTDDGTVTLPEGFFAKMKEAKPYLFGASPATTTSSTAPKPAEQPGTAKKFDEMTTDEQTAWKRSVGIR